MVRKIEITVEIYRPNDSTEYEDLPEGWDDWSERKQQDYLVQLAVDYQEAHIGSGATVVEVEE